MGNQRKLRLIQVAKEFNVGINTITDFLQKKGIKSDGSPNSVIESSTYAVLEKEYGSNRAAGEAREEVRERISMKPASVTLEQAEKQEREEEKEVVIKSNVISVKDEVQQATILGKIDLSPKPKKSVQPEAQPKAQPEVKAEAKPEPREEAKPEPREEVKPEAKPEVKAAEPREEAPARLQEEHKSVEEPSPKEDSLKKQTITHEVKETKNETPQNHGAKMPKAQTPQKPAASEAETVTATPKEREAEPKKDGIFRTETPILQGPQVLGTMDVSGIVPGGRRKRKRIQKEKVDVNKTAAKGASNGEKGHGKGGNAAAQNRKGGAAAQPAQPNPNQPKPGEGRRNKKNKKQNPKPVLRPEVSEEEVSKQIKDTLARLTSKGNKSKSAKYRKDKREAVAERMNEEFEREEQERSILKVTEFVTVSELATMMNVTPTEVITACMNLGLMVSINQRLDAEALVVVAEEFGYKIEFVSAEIQEAIADEEDDEKDLVPRPPIVTVMGHVDHGKTSLLDNIRKTNVIEGEAGGITQHIGAYSVKLNGQKITFLDTPGHEAFTAMRARGAAVTDVAVIIVAADDSVMPQTIEAINHSKAAGVPIIVAVNKCDKPEANPDKVRQMLTEYGIIPEEWGGQNMFVNVSAKKGQGIDDLLETILLQADVLELKANPDTFASGNIIEAKLDRGRGPVATLLVTRGTLHVGDTIVAGQSYGSVRAMLDQHGEHKDEARPSDAVEILGLNSVPAAGDEFRVFEDARDARSLAEQRALKARIEEQNKVKHVTLETLFDEMSQNELKELNLVVKADAQGTIEALADSIGKMDQSEVRINIIHSAVGAISETDVTLAMASNAIIIGFGVRPQPKARDAAERENVQIKTYSIIYKAIEDIDAARIGMLKPTEEEVQTGSAEVRDTFRVPKAGTIAGCMVTEGEISRDDKVRVVRDGVVVFDGSFGSMRRFKDDVNVVKRGYECGLGIEKFQDIKVGDILEAYKIIEVARTE